MYEKEQEEARKVLKWKSDFSMWILTNLEKFIWIMTQANVFSSKQYLVRE